MMTNAPLSAYQLTRVTPPAVPADASIARSRPTP